MRRVTSAASALTRLLLLKEVGGPAGRFEQGQSFFHEGLVGLPVIRPIARLGYDRFADLLYA